MDGKIVAQAPFGLGHGPFYLRIDNQVSGEWGHQTMPSFPNDYLIDWVHVYQHSSLTAVAPQAELITNNCPQLTLKPAASPQVKGAGTRSGR